jgi:methionyl-tRNA synthetase
MLKRYRNGIVPTRHDELAPDAAKVVADTQALLEQSDLQGALQSIWQLVNRANQYVDQTKPFSLAKDPAQAQRLDEVLYNLAESCRVLAVLLWPFIPGTTTKIFAQLGLPNSPDKFSAATWGGLQAGSHAKTRSSGMWMTRGDAHHPAGITLMRHRVWLEVPLKSASAEKLEFKL